MNFEEWGRGIDQSQKLGTFLTNKTTIQSVETEKVMAS